MSREKKSVECVRFQTLGEEIANAISHGIGALLAIAGAVILIVKAALYGSAIQVVSVSLYGAALITLYTISTLYHALACPGGKRVFQIFDHCSIFILILGTYIPISLGAIGGALGWVYFGICTLLAVLGIVFTSISLQRFHKIGMVLYIAMGWMIVCAFGPLLKIFSAKSLVLLVAGGLCYTLGILFYKRKSPKYMHFIWHLFVLAGSILHYFVVLEECCTI